MNNSPDLIAAINDFPIKTVDGKTVFVRDVAHVHDGYQVQTNSVTPNGLPGALMTGPQDRRRLDAGRHRRRPSCAARISSRLLPAGVSLKPIFDQSIFVKAALNSVMMGGLMAAA